MLRTGRFGWPSIYSLFMDRHSYSFFVGIFLLLLYLRTGGPRLPDDCVGEDHFRDNVDFFLTHLRWFPHDLHNFRIETLTGVRQILKGPRLIFTSREANREDELSSAASGWRSSVEIHVLAYNRPRSLLRLLKFTERQSARISGQETQHVMKMKWENCNGIEAR